MSPCSRRKSLLARGGSDEAEKFLKKATEKFSKNATVWMALINLAMYQADQTSDPAEREKRWQQASGYADQAEQSLGDHLMVREKRGQLAVRRKDPHVSAVLKKLGENLDKISPADRMRLWDSLAALSVQANDLDLGRSYYRLVAEKEPGNIRMRHALCDLDLQAYEKEKGRTPDLQEFDRRLDEIEQLGGRGAFLALRQGHPHLRAIQEDGSAIALGGPRLLAKGLGSPQRLVGPGRFGRQDLRAAGGTRSGLGVLQPCHLSSWEIATAT